jgi:hypothetical protein
LNEKLIYEVEEIIGMKYEQKTWHGWSTSQLNGTLVILAFIKPNAAFGKDTGNVLVGSFPMKQ